MVDPPKYIQCILQSMHDKVKLALWTPFSTPVEPCRRHARYGLSQYTLILALHAFTIIILYPMNYSDFRMEVHSRMGVQNGISEWKCIPE